MVEDLRQLKKNGLTELDAIRSRVDQLLIKTLHKKEDTVPLHEVNSEESNVGSDEETSEEVLYPNKMDKFRYEPDKKLSRKIHLQKNRIYVRLKKVNEACNVVDTYFWERSSFLDLHKKLVRNRSHHSQVSHFDFRYIKFVLREDNKVKV